MIEGAIIVEDRGETQKYQQGDWWYETNVQPITEWATDATGTRSIRVMIAPPEFEGFRTT